MHKRQLRSVCALLISFLLAVDFVHPFVRHLPPGRHHQALHRHNHPHSVFHLSADSSSSDSPDSSEETACNPPSGSDSQPQSQIDINRRSNRPSTIPLTVNLIARCMKEIDHDANSLEKINQMNDIVTSKLTHLESLDSKDVDSSTVSLLPAEKILLTGRIIQVVLRYSDLYDKMLEKVAEADPQIKRDSFGKLHDVYGITDYPLFEPGDVGGGVKKLNEKLGVENKDNSLPDLKELYLNTRVTCLLGLFVGEFESSIKDEDRIEGMGLIDFLEDDVKGVFFVK
ncbi:hypothetical protein TrVE_jg11701 [Triparma verrucosa]|uniref:Uncharacterized protein n=2 Tax=Triparma TaxID=722752 RepID=A0A9W7DVJ7_9STRA|nr:hypothetical protein TrST_g9050 [Triparma strigata]GMH89095.1 hypothetical protein TrVE_jg11701 [Triparma verrucosa]